ncbi:MAG TPA: hypothetical protein IAA26_11180 [Candidatus Blautia faecipullorum]|nr:hypothetical protein [Candidatus Blautia faecipullorum]
MEKETLATEVIKETQERLMNVITEIDCLDCDCAKAMFVVDEIMELIDVKPPVTEADVRHLHESMKRMDSFAGIMRDYIDKIQSCISDIVIRERSVKK